jgi:hypothetical protein
MSNDALSATIDPQSSPRSKTQFDACSNGNFVLPVFKGKSVHDFLGREASLTSSLYSAGADPNAETTVFSSFIFEP